MSYQILGRVVRSEYLAIGTLVGTAVISLAATSGGKKEAPAPAGKTVQEKISSVVQAVPLGAKSSEEEQLMDSIKKFIDEEESKLKH